MGVEPLGSVMTIQSQPVQKQVDNKPEPEKMDVSVTEQTVNADAATLSVAKTQQKDRAKEDTKDQSNNQAKDQPKELISEQAQQANNEKIKKAVEQLNKNMPHSEAVFGIHEKTNRVTIKIVDKETKEIIREFPPEQTLDMIAKVWELAGILVDEKR